MQFKKILAVSNSKSRVSRDEFTLERMCWTDLSAFKNLSDYDGLLINFTALQEVKEVTRLDAAKVSALFGVGSWAEILAASGQIVLVGDPGRLLRHSKEAAESLHGMIFFERDNRPLDYRRVAKPNSKFRLYLDLVLSWAYSWRSVSADDRLKHATNERGFQYTGNNNLGETSFSTILALQLRFVDVRRRGCPESRVTILPPSGRGSETEDLFVLQKCFGVPTGFEEPTWARTFMLPNQAEIENKISYGKKAAEKIAEQISKAEAELIECKRWYRLLYDDGDSLDAIVRESFESLRARPKKVSKEKDDYRIEISGHPKGVVEIKGTHNSKFNIGALRQLAGWMDEATIDEGKEVKGIFVGNAARTEAPQNRGKLFEKNVESFASIRKIAILRSVDLFCLVVLNQLNKLDVADFWQQLFRCSGEFDATKYWHVLPEQFALVSNRPPDNSVQG